MPDSNHRYVRKFSLTFALVIAGISSVLFIAVIILYASLSYIVEMF